MRGAYLCEKLGWRLAWLARILAHHKYRSGSTQPLGAVWQDLVYTTACATRPHLDIQGPGRGKLFGKYGASGMAAEVDTAIDDGAGVLSLVESKAVVDFSLRRDHVFIFSSKVRDHEASQAFRWRRVHALFASAGRVDAIFCRWCFREGIDVLDPDRLPLNVLARLPYLLSPDEFAALEEDYLYDWLWDVLKVDDQEGISGPILLRHSKRLAQLSEPALHDLNDIQARLSDAVWRSFVRYAVKDGTDDQRQGALLDRAQAEFNALGVTLPMAFESEIVPLPKAPKVGRS